ncbi:hypothetical protein WJX79_009208 [Trebouxia sp. C0005]
MLYRRLFEELCVDWLRMAQ